jgi:hypothetical protein
VYHGFLKKTMFLQKKVKKMAETAADRCLGSDPSGRVRKRWLMPVWGQTPGDEPARKKAADISTGTRGV